MGGPWKARQCVLRTLCPARWGPVCTHGGLQHGGALTSWGLTGPEEFTRPAGSANPFPLIFLLLFYILSLVNSS